MLCQLVLLVLFSSLQPGRLQEEGADDSLFQNINNNIVNLNSLIRSYIRQSEQFRAQMRADLSSLNDSVSNLSMHLQEHKQQTSAELAQLQTSFNTTQSSLTQQVNAKLNTLTTSLSQHKQQTTSYQETANSKLEALRATAAQLSADRQQIQTNISDMECMDTEERLQLQQNLLSNLTYNVEDIGTKVNTLYNQLQRFTCGSTGGWRRVAYLDMTDPNTTCPSGWSMTGYSRRTCGRAINTCDSVTFLVGGEYSRVCGRVKAYQFGSPDGFWRYYARHATTIDSAYVDGVIVTHGSPRQHIWTFAAGLAEGSRTHSTVCPCDADITRPLPPFVGNDYFCESGVNEPWDGSRHYIFHPNDNLWDGENCLSSSTCCSLHNPPYFVKQLPAPTIDNIETRICLDEALSNENIAVELVELYVQ